MQTKTKTSRRSAALGVGGLLALGVLAAACGSSPSAGSGTPPPAAVVKTGQDAAAATILVNSNGFAIYHRTTDSKDLSTCTGTCATIWMPVTVRSSSNLAVSGMTGFSTFSRQGGALQLEYKGEPLYTYTGDASAGQTSGQGLSGIWYVVAPGASGSGGGTTTTTSGGYHY